MSEVAISADLEYSYFKKSLPLTNGSHLGASVSSLRALITFVSLPVCPSCAHVLSEIPTGRTSAKLGIGDFDEELSQNPKFG